MMKHTSRFLGCALGLCSLGLSAAPVTLAQLEVERVDMKEATHVVLYTTTHSSLGGICGASGGAVSTHTVILLSGAPLYRAALATALSARATRGTVTITVDDTVCHAQYGNMYPIVQTLKWD